jgi:imidazolonepropionase-like amidohydrolase
VAAIGAQARESNVMLACHSQASEAIKMAVRHGFRALYHCSLADAEALDMLEAHRDTLFVAPAVGLLWARAHEAHDFGITRDVAAKMGVFASLERMQRLIPEMKRRGIRVLPGGDYGFPYLPIGTNARDLEHFVNLFGYTPTEVLVAATRLGGELMGKGERIGMLQPGYLADLLVVRGDPTSDVRILQNHANITVIMKDGVFYKR